MISNKSQPQGPACFVHHPDDQNSMDVVKVHGEMLKDSQDCQCSVLALILVSSFLLLWSGIYLGTNSGGFRGDVFNEMQVTYGPVKSAEGTATKEDVHVKNGKKVYMATCAACHLPTGLGDPSSGRPPLAGSDWVHGPWNRVAAIVLKGVEGPIKVNGTDFHTAAMTNHDSILTDDQIADVITYVRQAWGNKANPVSMEQVASMRERFKARSNPWKSPELLAMPEEKTPEAAAPAPAK